MLVWIVENTTQEIEKEKLTQIDANSHYSKQIVILAKELDNTTKEWTNKFQDIEIQFEKATEIRDRNLKVLLELRLALQEREKKRDLERQEKECLEAERDEKERQHHAATILQNKVKVMYLSKLKKKASKGGGKKKKSSKKKKKK